jgi:hypothetical protein
MRVIFYQLCFVLAKALHIEEYYTDECPYNMENQVVSKEAKAHGNAWDMQT